MSFDYELFFGDSSGTVKKSLIDPTNQLLSAMDSVGLKGNFFIDWQILKYLSLENDEICRQDYLLITEQLKDIIKRGHRIELHIHPHWVDAKYNGDGTWDFSNFTHYSLNTFSKEEIIDIFEEGAQTLTSIAREVSPDYSLCAFRAGGWAVQPFDKVYAGMDAVNIKIDSSVMPGFKITCQHSKCNFLVTPMTEKGYYFFSNDVCQEDKEGKYIEVPITTIIPGFLFRFVRKISRIFKMNFKTLSDGTHLRAKDLQDVWEVPQGHVVVSFSGNNPICAALTPLYSHSEIVCFIDHPKDVSKYAAKGIRLLGHLYPKSIFYKDLIQN